MKKQELQWMMWQLRCKCYLWRRSYDRPSCKKLYKAINSRTLRKQFQVETFYQNTPTTIDGFFRGMSFHLYARFRIWEFRLLELSAADHPEIDASDTFTDQVGFFPVGEFGGKDVRGFCISGHYGREQFAASWIPEPHALMLARIGCHAYELALAGEKFPLAEFAIGSAPVTVSVGQSAMAGTYAPNALGHLLFGLPSPGSEGIQ